MNEVNSTRKDDLEEVPRVYKKIMFSLLRASNHPVAERVKTHLGFTMSVPPVVSLFEDPGAKYSGFVYGKHYDIRVAAQGTEIEVVFSEERSPIFQFSINS